MSFSHIFCPTPNHKICCKNKNCIFVSYHFVFIFYCFCSSSAAPPTFSIRPEDLRVGLNGMANFECVASGNPPPSVFWTKEGSQMLMFPDNSYGHTHVTTDGTLQIRGVQKDDAGYFVCSALSVAGSATTRAFLQVTSVDDIPPPIIQIGPANQTLPVGSMVTLPCRATGAPTPRVRWYKDGTPLQTGQRIIIVQSGFLKIDGKHLCAAYTLIDNKCLRRGFFRFGQIHWSICLCFLSFPSIAPAQNCWWPTRVCIRAPHHRRVAKHPGQPRSR